MGGRGRNSDRYYLDEDSQGKHIVGHNNYRAGEKSPITISKERLQELFHQYRGIGERRGHTEIVNFNEVIGKYKNWQTDQWEDTTWGKIHYREDGGYHIVPSVPK